MRKLGVGGKSSLALTMLDLIMPNGQGKRRFEKIATCVDSMV